MASPHPKFQPQLPKENCVIDGILLGGVSCTAYAMAMLIDAATDGVDRPKGCKVRRLVNPEDLDQGLMLSQVAKVAERKFKVPISIRTGTRAVKVEAAARRIRNGRGFVLQGNTVVFDRPPVNHAVYVHKVFGEDPANDGMPLTALVFDPARQGAQKWSWRKVAAFGAHLRFDEKGERTVGKGLMYAGFAPRRPQPEEFEADPGVLQESGVRLRFNAVEFKGGKRKFRADVPRGMEVTVRRRPDQIDKSDVIDTLAKGEKFVGWQRLEEGAKPPGANRGVWIGNKDGTEWVHRAGLRKIVEDDD